MQADLKVNPAVWSKLTDEAKGLMTALLNKNPKYVLYLCCRMAVQQLLVSLLLRALV